MMADKKEYIERVALIEHIENMPWKITPAAEISKGIFLQTVEEAPAADVVEVVYGEWIDKPTGAYGRMQSWCSACGKHSGIGGIESNRHKPYCPNCGAKMDGGKEQT